MSIDKNKAVKDWLLTCPEIQADKLYFNFLKAEEGLQGFVTNTQEETIEDITGDKIGKYDFSIIDFRSMSNAPILFTDEDLNKMADVQKILDWVSETKEHPDFGENITIDEIYPLADNPELAGIEQLETFNIAKYMVAIRIEYWQKN